MMDGMYFINSIREKVLFNTPSYIGTAILDLSKLEMLKFHYGYMKPKYGDKCTLLYTDTDSFVYEIETNDLFKDQYNDRHLFDLSDCHIKKINDKTNKKILGKMKDETGMDPIIEFIALAPKIYSMTTRSGHNKKVGKGISRAVLRDDLNHNDYNIVLNNNEVISKPQVGIRSKNHCLYTIQQDKKTLTSFDDKMHRFDTNSGVPHGHYSLGQTR